jgi:hypothetical protein
MGVKLNILNAMLASIGSSAIVTETGTNPNLLLAQPILDRKNLTVQAQGHWFNTDWSLELAPTANGEFILPQNTLKAQPSDHSAVYVRRGVRMYDPTEHTYNITGLDTMSLNVVIKLDFDDLPQTAIDYIEASAILEMVTNFDSDPATVKVRTQSFALAREAFNIERRSLRNISLKDNPTYARIVAGGYRHGVQPNPNIIGGYYG